MNASNSFTGKKLQSVYLAGLFLSGIYLPFFTGIVQEDHSVSVLEKRTLNTAPSLPDNPQSLREFPGKFNSYYADHFGFRDILAILHHKINRRMSINTGTSHMTTGRDGWMFLGSVKPGYQHYGDPFGDWLNINRFTQKELERFGTTIQATQDWLKQRGIAYLYVIVPNKHTIYPDKLPEYLSKQFPKSATDQVADYLRTHTEVNFVDLRAPLLEERKHRVVFYKHDSHWNHYGANIAQFEIMRTVSRSLERSQPPILLNPDQFRIESRKGGDLARLAQLQTIEEPAPMPLFESQEDPLSLLESTNRRTPYTLTSDFGEHSAFIFRDSFFTLLQPYITRQFRESTYFWEKISFERLQENIEEGKPDIVIEEVIERVFPYQPSWNSE